MNGAERQERLNEHLLSCWIIEAARSAVLEGRGHQDSAVRISERARILAKRCAAEGFKIRPDFAKAHAEWMASVTGSKDDTGDLGWFFLQRLGTYSEIHISDFLDPPDRERFRELGAPDAEAVEKALGEKGIPPAPPPEFPQAETAQAPGRAWVRIGVIGDPHVGIPETSDRIVPVVVEDLNREGVDFSVAIGDLTQNGQAYMFERAKEFLDRLQMPWAVTLGNHDMWGYDTTEPVGLQRFENAFGVEPYSINEVKGVRIIMVNSADPTASPFPPFDIVMGGFTAEPNESVPGGRISEEVAEWMAGIKADGPTFIVLHHEPFPYLGFPPLVFGMDDKSSQALADLVRRTRAWGVICGHTHRSATYDFAGAPLLEVPCAKEWPFGYGVIEVSDDGWAFNLKKISDQEIVSEQSRRFSILHRRYAGGPDEARAFVWKA